MVVFAGAVVMGATGAFFSDTETSTGNVFAAGAIDLQIDNESYVMDCNVLFDCEGVLILSTTTSWTLTDLTVEKFFNFFDLKPGDLGEDTISIHVGSNDAWLCAAANITADDDNSITEPELEDGDLDPGGVGGGDLDSALNFAFWVDDGDNVFEPTEGQNGGEPEVIFLEGPLSGLGNAGEIALAAPTGDNPFGNEPVPGGKTVYIAKAWCFGTLTDTDLEQDGSGEARSPLTGTGFNCDGQAVDNLAQTDSVEGDLTFYAEQARNNPNFTCNILPE